VKAERGGTVGQYEVILALRRAVLHSLTPKIVCESWAKPGLWPINIDRPLKAAFKSSAVLVIKTDEEKAATTALQLNKDEVRQMKMPSAVVLKAVKKRKKRRPHMRFGGRQIDKDTVTQMEAERKAFEEQKVREKAEVKETKRVEKARIREQKKKAQDAEKEEKKKAKQAQRESKQQDKNKNRRKSKKRKKNSDKENENPNTPAAPSQQRTKRKIKKKRKALSPVHAVDDNEYSTCGICSLGTIAEGMVWIGCDACDLWFHAMCANVSDVEKDYECALCKMKKLVEG